MGGAFGRVPEDATAFPNRAAAVLAEHLRLLARSRRRRGADRLGQGLLDAVAATRWRPVRELPRARRDATPGRRPWPPTGRPSSSASSRSSAATTRRTCSGSTTTSRRAEGAQRLRANPGQGRPTADARVAGARSVSRRPGARPPAPSPRGRRASAARGAPRPACSPRRRTPGWRPRSPRACRGRARRGPRPHR